MVLMNTPLLNVTGDITDKNNAHGSMNTLRTDYHVLTRTVAERAARLIQPDHHHADPAGHVRLKQNFVGFARDIGQVCRIYL
jgi:hypothetical protein